MPAALPQHPFVPLRQIFRNLAERYIPSRLLRALFLLFSRLWLLIARVSKHEERIRDCFARGENGFASKHTRFPSLFYPEFAASCLLDERAEEDPLRRATQLIIGALRFRQQVLDGTLEIDQEGGKELDMQRYGLLFSRLTRSYVEKGVLVHEGIHLPPSEHIAVAVDGVFYKLQVLQGTEILPPQVVHAQLVALMQDARAQLRDSRSDRFPFGLYTVLQNRETVAAYAALQERCRDAVSEIESALFFLALDLHDTPQSLERLGRVLHTRNPHSRDYRRSIQLVVTANGLAGAVGDPNSGIGGWFIARFIEHLAREGKAIQAELGAPRTRDSEEGADSGPLRFVRLHFSSELLAQHQPILTAVERRIQEQSYLSGQDTIYHLDGIGKKALTLPGLSVDGVFHAALHLAFKRCFGKAPEIGNFISLRAVQHGEVFLYNATSDEMKRFVDAPDSARAVAAVAAVHRHKAIIKQLKQATDDLYLLSMTFKTMFNRGELGPVRTALLLLLLLVFIRGFRRRVLSPDMWVSHMPELPGVALTGRPGMKLSFLTPPALGGHYLLFEDSITVCFVSTPGKKSYAGREKQFVAHLGDALREVRALLQDQGKSSERAQRPRPTEAPSAAGQRDA